MAANTNHFGLTLDTVAPKGSISAQASYNAQGKVTITYDSDASQMKVWYTSSPVGSKSDSNYPTEWEAVAKEKNTAFTSDGTYYYHVVFKDSVANESEVFNSDAIVYETSAASVTSVTINDNAAYTKSRTGNKITFTFTTALTAISSVTMTGDIVGSPVIITLTEDEIAARSATRNFDFTSSAAQGIQTVTITLVTVAGNSSSASDAITLDTTTASGTLTLRNSTNTANLPTHINYTAIGVRIDCTDEDWASYVITGPFSEHSEGDEAGTIRGAVTASEKINKYVFKTITLNAGDGVKTINARIYDNAGNETILTAASVTLDQTKPVVVLSLSKDIISRQTHFNSSTLTIGVTETGSSTASYSINIDEDAVKSGEGIPPTTFEITADMLATEGTHTISVSVTDGSGNTGSTNKDIKLDVTSPEVITPTITNYGGYIGGNLVDTEAGFIRLNQISVTSGATDASAIEYSYCWINNKATDTTLPADSYRQVGAKTSFDYSAIKTDTISEGAANYVHVAYIDEVGNIAFGHSAGVIIDTVVPNAGSISGLPTICHKTANIISINPNDTNISVGHGWYKLWGDIKAAATETVATWTAYNGPSVSIEFTGASASATKTIYLKWRDAAGNVQAADVASAATQLDTVAPTASLTLVDTSDAITIAGSKRSINTFKARVSGSDDEGTGNASAYVLYGNIKIGSTTYPTSLKTYNASTAYAVGDFVTFVVEGQEQIRRITEAGTYTTWAALEAASSDAFTALTYTTGKQYYLTDTITGTVAQGANPVYLKVRDDAGNVSDVVTQSFIYDTTAPVATVGNVDRSIISKVHEKLETKTSYISNDATAKDKEGYADYVAFNFTSSEKVIAWKVCAYLTQTAAEQGSADDAAIPMTNGSINTSGAGIEADASIAVLINGADYEAALGEVGKVDGAHIVVVYVQDEAGTWSGKAVFA